MATPGFTLASLRPRVGIPLLPGHPFSSFQFLFLSAVAVVVAAYRMRRCVVPGSGESAANYEQVRCYCFSRVHARARQPRGAGQSRRRYGSAVPEGSPRQSGRHVSREGEWSRNWIAVREIVLRDYPNNLALRWDFFGFLFVSRLDMKNVLSRWIFQRRMWKKNWIFFSLDVVFFFRF